MTYAEYVGWYDKEAGRRGEWVDGEVIVFVSTTFRHEHILMFLGTLLTSILRRRRAGIVLGAGYEMQAREGSAREPDLQVVLNEHLDRLTERRLLGGADLVVEITSPDSFTRDRREKFAEYAAAGIPEYWVVDPRDGKESADIFVLVEGRYVAVEPDAEGRIASTVVAGVWFDPAWLTAEELPDVIDLALEMVANVPATTEF